jgi:integrase
MALRMTQPLKDPRTGKYIFRKAIPKRLRSRLGGKTEVQITLGTSDPAEARERFVVVAAQVQAEWKAAEAMPDPDAASEERPRLTFKRLQGLAGEYYRWLVAKHDEEPGARQRWLDELAEVDRVTRRLPNRPPGTMTAFLPKARAFLEEKGYALDDLDVWELARAIVTADRLAKQHLAKNAVGDYSSDPAAERFPKWEEPEMKPTAEAVERTAAGAAPTTRRVALTVEAHFDDFAKACGLSLGTMKRWRPVLKSLANFAKTDDLSEVGMETIFAWRKELLEQGRSAKTVGEVYLASARSFFNWAVENQLAGANPAADIKVRVKKKAAATDREAPGFEDAEANAILSEALRPPVGKESRRFTAAKRWIPWLCAYSGARVNEITQMRREDVSIRTIDREEVWVIARGRDREDGGGPRRAAPSAPGRAGFPPVGRRTAGGSAVLRSCVGAWRQEGEPAVRQGRRQACRMGARLGHR